tara:strand:- start:440 stop:541 length:102 start_codon:yes stop_codon:yes gene_type:complete
MIALIIIGYLILSVAATFLIARAIGIANKRDDD